MEATTQPTNTAPAAPLPNLDLLIVAIANRTRWKMLKELSRGETRTLGEMAKVAECSTDNASKHLARLRAAGLVVQGRGKLYEIARCYLPVVGQPVLECGHCLLRLDAA